MEELNSAARAAGFAMAASEEPYAEVKVEARPAETQLRPGEAVARSEPARVGPRVGPRVGDWVRGMLGLFGRRAPASSA
jgi:hypothetical protein